MSRPIPASRRIQAASGLLLVAGLAAACGGGAKPAVSARSVATTSTQDAGAGTSTSTEPASSSTSTSAGVSSSTVASSSVTTATTKAAPSGTTASRATATTGATTTTTVRAPTTTVAPTTTTRASTTTTTSAPTAVSATETEYHIALSTGTFHSGSYVFTAENHGQLTHNLIISGNGTTEQTPNLAPGESASLKLDLRPGSYELYCGIPGHRQAGMDVTIQAT